MTLYLNVLTFGECYSFLVSKVVVVGAEGESIVFTASCLLNCK